MPAQAWTYNDPSIVESRWNKIKALDAINTYVTSNADLVEVGQKVHSWDQDDIATISSQEVTVEGADTTYSVTDPTQLSNYTQIIEKGYQVSASTENSKHAAFKSRKAKEIAKKMKEAKNSFEWSAINGTAAAGNTTTARAMKGIRNFAVSAYTTAETAGTSLTSALLNSYLAKNWNAGAQIDTLLVGTGVKGKIDSFTVNNTRNIQAKDAELVGRVDVYDSSYGRVEVVLHRYITAGEIIGYIKEHVMVGFLDPFHNEDRAKTGYSHKGAVVGEGTVQVNNSKAILLATGLTGA